MPTYRECGAILAVMLLAGTLGLCSLLDGTSGLTTGGRSKVSAEKMTQLFEGRMWSKLDYWS